MSDVCQVMTEDRYIGERGDWDIERRIGAFMVLEDL